MSKYRGGLIAESIRVGTRLDGLPMLITRISRRAVDNATPDQPNVWTMIEFEVDASHAEQLATALSQVLNEPGWYTDVQSESDVFVAFPGRVFRYRRGDRQALAEVQIHARTLGIPDSQLDW